MNTQTQVSNFTILPAIIRYADISDFAKILYTEILGRSKQKGYCFTSNKRFSEIFGLKDEQNSKVKRALAILSKAGFIQSVGNGLKRLIYPLFDELSHRREIFPTNEKSEEKEFHPSERLNFSKQQGATEVQHIPILKQQTATGSNRVQQIEYFNRVTDSNNEQQGATDSNNSSVLMMQQTATSATMHHFTVNWSNSTPIFFLSEQKQVQQCTSNECRTAPHNSKGNNKVKKVNTFSFFSNYSLVQNRTKTASETIFPSNEKPKKPIDSPKTNDWSRVYTCFSYQGKEFLTKVKRYVSLLQRKQKLNPSYLMKANEYLCLYAKTEKQACEVLEQAIVNFEAQKGSIRPLGWSARPSEKKLHPVSNSFILETADDLVKQVNRFNDFWQLEKWLNDRVCHIPQKMIQLYDALSISQKKEIKNAWFYDLQRAVNRVRVS